VPTDPIVATAPARYPRIAVLLHWSVALLIATLLVTGWYMVGLSKNTWERALLFNLHKSLGIVSMLFITALIVWRLLHEVPPLPSAMPRWESKAATLNHRMFYVLMVLATLSGYLTSSFSKFGPKLVGIALPHWGWEDELLRSEFAAVHRVTAVVFAVFIAVHIGAAVKHLIVDKDGVFQRMLLK
jgi:cytochrome b561